MAHTNARSQEGNPSPTQWSRIIPVCLGLLPFSNTMFIGLLGLLGLSFWQTYTHPKALLKLLHQRGFLVLSGLLLLSSTQAVYPGEAFLQLTHFLPFFWFWAVLVLYLKNTSSPWLQISRWALVLVLTSVPINLVGIFEYVLKRRVPLDQLTAFPVIDWFYIGDLNHPRTFSLFDYPNTLASYLVMILGLNLGLLFIGQGKTFFKRLSFGVRGLLAANILLTLLCLFCSGSRNGYLVAALLLLLSLLSVRAPGWVRSLGLAGLAFMTLMTLRFGLAGRSLSWSWVTDDPRVKVWGLALQMIRDRPLLGQGLGNYKLLYNGEVPGYDSIAHAHNLWLKLGAEAGLPLMIGFTLAIGLICYRGVKALMSLRTYPHHYAILLAYSLSFLGITLFSCLDVTLFEGRVNLLGWLSLAVLYCGPDLSRDLGGTVTNPSLDQKQVPLPQ
jgi:O-antigen ligase